MVVTREVKKHSLQGKIATVGLVSDRERKDEQAQRELDKAREDAERSETEYQKLLSKARDEALKATGAQLQRLTEQIGSFEAKLDEARKKKERAIARAQLTKSGFVYVISNIGSFGEGIFKIGMTRRLEPMDRVIELGDASVPFGFDHGVCGLPAVPGFKGKHGEQLSARAQTSTPSCGGMG